MSPSAYPMLYQINTRVWLTELSGKLGRPATLDDIPDTELDRLACLGFDWVWFLSVWQTGPEAQQISRAIPEWRADFEETLPDLTEEDIQGSGFAITGYTVHENLGGDAALARLRERLRKHGLKLMLDFVPNHMGLGHPWVNSHPDYFIQGTGNDLAQAPHNFVWVKSRQRDLLLAHGRDPYFSGWADTLQLNYANSALQMAMIGELVRIAGQCDGVRCDMAMLVHPEVFERTWGKHAPLFWPLAIKQVRENYPRFLFLAEVYWDLEWTLQQQGFDYTYDKRLYDRLRDRHARPVREHLCAGLDFQNKLARFLENHDEPRAAATFSYDVHQAAAAVSFLAPGLRFFHDGQFEGRQKRISPHLVRAPKEPANPDLKRFYDRLLTVLRQPVIRNGAWLLLECTPAWDGNRTNDDFLVSAWRSQARETLVVAVNYSPHQSQCYVRLPFEDLDSLKWRLCDQLSAACYEREGSELCGRGLYLDMAPWQSAVFSLERVG
jgi:Alpha amylase, catalytic domain